MEVFKINNNSLGRTIKSLRLERKIALKDLAAKVDVSSSLISQIERGLANPSLNTLREIAMALDVPVYTLFIEENSKKAYIVRKEDRIKISNDSKSEYFEQYELLLPNLSGDIVLCAINLGPSEYNSENLKEHKGEEVAVVTKGTLKLILENDSYILNEGDSVKIQKHTPHRWVNPSDSQEACLIFATESSSL